MTPKIWAKHTHNKVVYCRFKKKLFIYYFEFVRTVILSGRSTFWRFEAKFVWVKNNVIPCITFDSTSLIFNISLSFLSETERWNSPN